MAEDNNDILSLDSEYQKLLQEVQKHYDITITLLQKLRGGKTNALLYLSNISSKDKQELRILKFETLVMKSGFKNSEADRHRIALSKAPQAFAKNHMAKLVFDPVVSGDRVAIFYEIAGDSLQRCRPISSYQQQNQLENIFGKVCWGLLTEWNPSMLFQEIAHPQQLLGHWLGSRIQPGKGNIERHLEEACHFSSTADTLLLESSMESPPLPNPLAYARDQRLWETPRPAIAASGFLHGDLNLGNVLVGFDRSGKKLEQYYLIDLALFQENSYLFYDQLYLEMSYLIERVPRVPLEDWIRFIRLLAEQDLPVQGMMPTELASTAAIVASARKSFDDWARNSSHSGMYDDLWGQFRLAAVAVGLNFCNKPGLSKQEHFAALLYAAYHLRQYCQKFDIPIASKEVNKIALADKAATGELGDDWRAFLEACHAFDSGRLYMLVIGPQAEKNKLPLSSLGRVNWSLVFDFDPDTDISGLCLLVKKEIEQRKRTVHLLTSEDRESLTFNPLRATYWYAARGLRGRSGTLPADDTFLGWNRMYGSKLLTQPIEALKGVSGELALTVVVLWNAQNYIQKIYELVDYMFGDRADFVFALPEPEIFSSLPYEYIRHFSLEPERIALGFRSFFSSFHEEEEILLPAAGDAGVDSRPVALTPSDAHRLEEELTLVHLGLGAEEEAAGSEVEEEPDRKAGYAFLRGNRISWFELAIHLDVEREEITGSQGYPQSFKNQAKEDLDRRNATRYNLFHHPGAGGTTAGLRLIWDLHKIYPTVLLHRYSRQTLAHFRDLARYTRKPILAMVESAEISPDLLDRLYSQILGENLPVVFLLVSRRFTRPANSRRSIYLDSILPTDEAKLFAHIYGEAVPNRRKALDDLVKKTQQRIPFFFGLTAFEEEFIQLDSYVRTRLEEMTPTEGKIMAYLGLAYWYAQMELPVQVFRKIIGGPPEREVSLGRALKQQRYSLLVYEPEKGWRPSHALIAQTIIQQILAARAQDPRVWRENLSTWAISLIADFAALSSSPSAVPSNLVLELLKKLFIVRGSEGVELPVPGNNEANMQGLPRKPHFTRLIEDMPSPEGRFDVMKCLKERFPEETHFGAHFGRLQSYQGRYEEGLEAADEAIDLDASKNANLESSDSVLHHIRGMILRYWAASLMSTIEGRGQKPLQEEQLLKIDTLISQAESAFTKSREFDPHGEPAYIAHIQLLVRATQFGFRLSGKSRYAEFLASSQYLSYQNMVERAENLLAEVKRLLYFGKQPSNYLARCEVDLDMFYENYSQILVNMNNLLSQQDIYKPPIRRGIVDIYLAHSNRDWDGLSRKDLDRIVTLMQQNLEAEPDNGEYTRLLFEAMRRIPDASIVTARERLRYWFARSDSIDAVYYLYVLTVLEAIDGSADAAKQAKELIEQCKQRSHVLPGALQHASRDWVGKGLGMARLISHKKLGPFVEAKNFFQDDSLLVRVRGRIIDARRPESGKIELECGLEAFFVPEQKGPPPVNLTHHENERLDSFLAFSHQGLRAWSPVLIP